MAGWVYFVTRLLVKSFLWFLAADWQSKIWRAECCRKRNLFITMSSQLDDESHALFMNSDGSHDRVTMSG
jgi:hypothetical protein